MFNKVINFVIKIWTHNIYLPVTPKATDEEFSSGTIMNIIAKVTTK